MRKSLFIIPFFIVSCEKEVIEPAKYLAALNSGKPATEVKEERKPFRLRLRKRKRKYEKINRTTVSVSNRHYRYNSSRYSGNADSSIRNIGSNTNTNH